MTQKSIRNKPAVKNKKDKSLLIVGIGASAGGLEALEKLFSGMSPRSNIAFVVVQHLSPGYKSIMADLLGKFTEMKVIEITDGMRVDPNIIYLNPPGKVVDIIKRTLHLSEADALRGTRLPIDHFFKSLADDQRERAVCIILSGTGTDGTLGLKAIKDEGGVAMVQAEAQAKFSGMPESAISTGMIDHVLPVEEMSRILVNFAGHTYFRSPAKHDLKGKEFSLSLLQKIFLIIRTKTGHDFSNYKLPTLRRRLERRMAIHQIKEMSDYLKFLKEIPEEADTLYKDFLIGVTKFFRDPEAFGFLQKKAVTEIVKSKPPNGIIRVWVPGCATGEEAYSIAMLFVESMEAAGKHLTLQIFATDIDKEALEQARLGTYSKSIFPDVSPERLKHFFTHEDKDYKIKKYIRDMVVFAEQNVARDPPFSKLDLVSCRNVLIYMDQILQKKILPLFYYTLNEGGYLFLGSSESLGKGSDLFSTVNNKWKIFRRKDLVVKRVFPPFELPLVEIKPKPPDGSKKSYPESVRDIAEKLLLDEYGSSGVLVDEKFDILHFYGRTDRYLSLPSGEPNFNILKMVREDLSQPLSLALHKAVVQRKTIVVKVRSAREDEASRDINLVVKPIVSGKSGALGLIMVIFEEKFERKASEKKGSRKKDKAPGAREAYPKIAALELELQSTREYLQTTIEELETSNEEMKSTNEEMQSTNEELQSTNEEIETSKEELQSTNEELVTLNSELHARVEELAQVNNDQQNFLSSTEIGTIFLDTAFCIRRFTPAAAKVFNLIPSDVGRPISDITSRLEPDRPISGEAMKVLKTLIPENVEVRTKDGEWFSAKILPYRTTENLIDGLVLTFSEITPLKKIELVLEEAKSYAENIVETIREPLLVLDSELRVISANRAFYRFFQVTSEETKSKLIYEIGNHQWDIPNLRKLLEEIIPKNTFFENFEVEHVFRNIGRRKMFLNARKIEQNDGKSNLILIAFEDKT
jgi:two-component system CheB/CheR fusion protein